MTELLYENGFEWEDYESIDDLNSLDTKSLCDDDIPEVGEKANESWEDWLSRFMAAANMRDIIEGHLIDVSGGNYERG